MVHLKDLSKEERDEFREVVQEAFLNMEKNITERMINFENKILNTIGEREEAEDIYVVLLDKADYYEYETMFFPILSAGEEDLKEIILSEDKIVKEVYLPLLPENLSHIEDEIFIGEIKKEDKIYNIKFRLEKNRKYEKMMKLLYDTFALNNLKWKTILNPYISKMYELKIIDFDKELLDIMTGKEKINFSDSGIKKYLEKDVMLCWNVEIKPIVGESVVSPTRNSIHLNHYLTFSNNKNVYVCPADYYIYMVEKLNTEQILAVTEDIKNIVWKVAEIKKLYRGNIIENLKSKLKYPLFTNEMNFHFINRIRFKNEKRIRTFGELERIANSFKVFSDYFALKEANVVDYVENVKTTEINSFIQDEFRLKGQEKFLKIVVDARKNDEYTLDVLNFIISEIQLYFPEYRCVGEIR